MRFSSAFLIALCASPLLFCPASAQTAPGQTLRSTQLLAPSASVWGRALNSVQNRALAQRSLQARDRAFEWLEQQAGEVAAPNFNSLSGAGDLEGATWNRYRAVTGDGTLTRRQRERVIAGMVHQDLQLAEVGMEQGDQAVQRRALRVASIATLYCGMLEDDPRMQGALYEGFLLPHLDLAPPRGWSGAGAILEGASVAFRRSGRLQERREVLLTLLGRQTGAGDATGADMTRVHLADAFAAEGYYQNAIETLGAVTSPELLGARAIITELSDSLIQSNRVNKEAWESARQAVIEARIAAGGGATTAQPLLANAPEGAAPGGAAPGGAAPGGAAPIGAAGALGSDAGGPGTLGTAPPGAIGGNGSRLAQGGVGGQRGARAGATDGTATETATQDEARAGESEKMRRVRLATEAARRAQELSKEAQEKATIALALLLDASEAQAALEAGEVGRAPARPSRARANGNAANAPAALAINLVALRQSAQRSALRASEAAGDAKRASIAAQKASEEAANLALRVFIVDHDTPKAGEAPAAKTPAPTPGELPVAAPAQPEVQGTAPIVNEGKGQGAPAAQFQTEDAN